MKHRQIFARVIGPMAAAVVSSNAFAQTEVIATIPHDLSPWGMFVQADLVVKAVIVGLFFASLVTWTIWLAKGIELLRARRTIDAAIAKVRAAGSLRKAAGEFSENRSVSGLLLQAADAEYENSIGLPTEGVKERAGIALSRIEQRAARKMTRGTGLLATIGATAPFVGLFGTVWGIMNSFVGISQSKTTNLAVVAPGIAEALLATAIGLFAAIPAVIIYNVFARAISGYRLALSDLSAMTMIHLSRALDERAITLEPKQRARAGG